jgi:hypothetical protein
MRTERPRTRPPIPARLGGFVAALAVALSALTHPAQALTTAGDPTTDSQGPSVSGHAPLPAQKALHSDITPTAASALRLLERGGCPSVFDQSTVVPRPTGGADQPAVARPATSRPPLSVLLCT